MTVRYDPHYYPYPSRRNVTYASRGMVCASQPQAAQAGLEILKKGGNAVDAIVATAAALTVVEPTANGIGSDAFALLWKDGKLRGLNASGPIPKALSMELARSKGWTGKLPMLGWACVVVFLLSFLLRDGRRSRLSSIAMCIGAVGLMAMGVEYCLDRYFLEVWQPSWSLVVLVICIGLIIPLRIVRRVPSLREEARRRFNM